MKKIDENSKKMDKNSRKTDKKIDKIKENRKANNIDILKNQI